MNIDKILKRINFDDRIKIDLSTLKKLQEAYLLNVTYDNLDFALKNDFSLELNKIYEKIVLKNRGGICYESNQLFNFLLNSLGFESYMIFAKVDDLTYIGKDYPHLTLIVKLHEIEYLVDVANGQSIREPMSIDDNTNISISEKKKYKIEKEKKTYYLKCLNSKEEWVLKYNFNTQKKEYKDFKSIFYEDTSREDFSKKVPMLVTLATKNGRITLIDDILRIKTDDKSKSFKCTDLNECLLKYFSTKL